MQHWSYKRVRVNDSWGAGAADTLGTPLARQPEFWMHPRRLRDLQGNPQLAHFTVDFPSGYLADGWQGVHFIPLGTDPVTGISGLPGWDPSQRDLYRRVIDGAVSLSDSRTARLEAIIPFVGQRGGVGYNRVSLFYVFDAVHAPIKDLVIIRIASHTPIPGTVQARQDGGAHGGSG